MIGDNRGLPASIAGLFGTALQLYARRIPFYLALALVALGAQYVVDTQLIAEDSGLMDGLQIVVDGFVAASVSIGVALDLAGQPADWSRIMTAASLRWGVVTLTQLVNFFVQILYIPNVFELKADPSTLFVLVPFVAFYGIVTIASVVAAIEPAKSRWRLPLIAFGKAFVISAQFVNLGRLFVLSALLTLPVLADLLLYMHIPRTYRDADFLAGVPLDALTLGPLQAVATVFYVDFLRRMRR